MLITEEVLNISYIQIVERSYTNERRKRATPLELSASRASFIAAVKPYRS